MTQSLVADGPRPRLLDLFCGAGGAGTGYHRAGFDVIGVDIAPQPDYPFEFFECDAIEYLLAVIETGWDHTSRDIHAIHASPPCQFATDYQRTGNVGESPNLIPETRRRLVQTKKPWVIENVEGAKPWLHAPLLLCGTMFDPPMEIQRHRLFESNVLLRYPDWPCRHKLNGRGRYPGGRSKARTGSSRGHVRATIEVGAWDIPLSVQQQAMGIDWMTLDELSEAIPPAYTELIGAQLFQYVRQGVAA